MFTFCSLVVYHLWIIVLPDIHIFAGERHGFPINLPDRHVPHTIVITDNRSSAGSCYQSLTQCFIWCNLWCTDIRSHGHSFPRDFWQGRTFVATWNDHPGHSWPHQMTTRTFVATSNVHPGHSCSHRSSLMQTNLYNLLFDEPIPRWVKETWQCVCRNICLMVRIWVLI